MALRQLKALRLSLLFVQRLRREYRYSPPRAAWSFESKALEPLPSLGPSLTLPL